MAGGMFRRFGFFSSMTRRGAVLFRAFLGFLQLLGGQVGFKLCHRFVSARMPFLHGEKVPGISLNRVLGYFMTLVIHGSEQEEGRDAALLRRLSKPTHGLFAVLRQMIPAVKYRP